jgi:hypothetical protein
LEIRAIREVRDVMKALKLEADRSAALSGARAAECGRCRSGIARAPGRTHRGRARPQAALAVARSARDAKGRTEVDVLNGAVAGAGASAACRRRSTAVFARVLERHRAHAPVVGEVSRAAASARAEVEAEERRMGALRSIRALNGAASAP